MELDSIQEEIVTSTAKNIIVSAGAGSGKTRVLTERIKYLLGKGIRPDSIVAITFTNKAAEEMKTRLFNVPGIGDTFIGTIHSFANRMYKHSGIPYDLLTADKEIDIIKYLIKLYAKYVTPEDYMEYIDMKKNIELGIISDSAMTARFNPSVLHEIEVFYGKTLSSESEEYPENIYTICEARNILTFDKLLKACSEYFKSIYGSLEYLLVDELQDIGYNEYNFLRAMNAENNFYVGDDWQSIYGFKGGDVRIFLRLMEDPNWTSYDMKFNYRNARNILDTAKTVILQADNILKKEIVPIREDMGKVEISSKSMLNLYLQKIKDSGDYKDWFILTRSNREIQEISIRLQTSGIPFISFKVGQNSQEELNMKMMMDSVKLLTVHTSKGLESKNVLLYGNFPLNTKPYLRNSDERKVMYTAITRAMDYLIILN